MGEEPNLTWTTRWEQALANIKDEQVKADLREFHSRAVICAGWRLILGSPVLLVVFLFAVLSLAVQTGLHNMTKIFTEATTATLSHAVDTRFMENEAAATAA